MPAVEQAILDLRSRWEAALSRKDIDGMMQCYAPHVVSYDLKPPLELDGVSALRKVWDDCMPYFPEQVRIETHHLVIRVAGTMAYASALVRFQGMEDAPPAARAWYRTSSVYQQIDGEWLIVHDHISAPFDPMTGQAVFMEQLESTQPV